MTATDSSTETPATTDGSGEPTAMVTTKEKNDKAKNGGTAESTNKGSDGKQSGTEASCATRVVVVALTPDRRRETWDKKVEFLLAVIGFAVDLGNVWRFPYICYQNGGGAFLIPYCLMLIFGGLPLFYMELALGQFHRCGCLTIWKRICPALKGIGYAICLIDVYMGMYYNTIIGWAVYYLFASFTSVLPWTSCDNAWNTANCTLVTAPDQYLNSTSPAKEFFERNVLEQQKSDGLNRMGPINSVTCAMCFRCVPSCVLFIMERSAQRRKGRVDNCVGSIYCANNSSGSWTLSSYNKFDNNCYRDAILTSSINCLTSFLAGFVIFSVLGYMAHVQRKSIEDVGLEGPGLVFIVYPEAIATMTGSVFWSIIFFLMLITLGLDSTFGGLEAMITALCDEYPRVLGRHREIFVAVLLLAIYICALPTTTYGGVYLVNMLNVYGPGLAILFVVFVEAAGVCWIYGTDNFARDVEKMIGHRPGIFWRVCWNYISPVFLLLIFIFSLLGYDEMLGGEYKYPEWSIKVGWVLTCSSIICIPLYMVYKFAITPGSLAQALTYDNDILTIFPSIIFLIFGHSLLYRYTHCLMEEYLGLDLRHKPWCRGFVVIMLHLHLTCSWIVFVSILREIGSLYELMFENAEPKAIVHSIMLFVYTSLGFLPCCTLIYDMTMESMVSQRVGNQEGVRYNLHSELGPEEILAHQANLYIPNTGKPHAYEIEQSCSCYMLMDLPQKKSLPRSNSCEFYGKVSNIEDIIAKEEEYTVDDYDTDYFSAHED
ncbi:Serotonin transporter [Carabus blaptoides fortunei]